MKQKGFTLIEMVVVLAVVAILAAILVPTIAKNIQDANITRAQNETQVIGAAIASFYKDLGRWPTSDGTSGNPDAHYLIFGPGNDSPATTPTQWDAAHANSSDMMDYHLVQNDPGTSDSPNNHTSGTVDYPLTGKWRWRGPYIPEISADPFGTHYSCNVRYLYNTITNAVYVLSAGPDKTWDTSFTQTMPGTIANDDIGTPVK